MSRGQLVVGLVLVPVAVGLCCFYRYGHWSFGPSTPAARDVCALEGGREKDLLLMHQCAPAARVGGS